MTWGMILQRSLGYPLINLGFSGNGRLEKEVLDFICEIDARLYILDCLPTSRQRAKMRSRNSYRTQSSKYVPPTPLRSY